MSLTSEMVVQILSDVLEGHQCHTRAWQPGVQHRHYKHRQDAVQ